MPYIVAAVVLLAAISILDLLLTFAIIRRLRAQASPVRRSQGFVPPELLPIGAQAPKFEALDSSGATVSLGSLAGQRSVLGFFSANCNSCRAHFPAFKDIAERLPSGSQQAVAIVSGDPVAAAAMAAPLAGVVSIVFEEEDGPVTKAFAIWGYPTFYALDEQGKIVAAGPTAESLISAALV